MEGRTRGPAPPQPLVDKRTEILIRASRNPFEKPHASVYLSHLQSITKTLRGRVRQNSRVKSIARTPSGWMLSTPKGNSGPYREVVIATGYFFNPAHPQPEPESDGSIRVIHAADITDYDFLSELRQEKIRVVVVGGRVTAGQLILELDERGIECALGMRSPIKFRRHGFVATLREASIFFWEELRSGLRPNDRRISYPEMEGGKTRSLVDSGNIAFLPKILSIKQGFATFADDSQLEAFAIVLATGYAPVLDVLPCTVPVDGYGTPQHLNFESIDFPDLYFLGLDNLRSHQSRYLRGIRSDAVLLARQLSKKRLREIS